MSSHQPTTFHEFIRGVKSALPILLGFIPLGFVLGARAAEQGLTLFEIPMLTGLNFAGGSEYAAVALWASPPPIFLIATITLLINSRHFLMSAALTPFIKHLPLRKVFPALFFMCDEAWAVTMTDIQKRRTQGITPFSLPFYLGTALSMYSTWVISTTLGGYTGHLIDDLSRWGLDMALPAVFLVIIRGMWKGLKPALPWFISLGVAVLSYLYIEGAWYVLLGSLVGLISAFLLGEQHD